MLRLVAMGCAASLLWLGQRQGELPDDGMASERFPTRVGRPDAGPPLVERGPKVQVVEPVAPNAGPNPCDGVPPQDQLSCPLVDRVVAIEPITNGIRLLVRRGPPPNRLRDQLMCQQSMAAVKPDTPPPCTFLGAGLNVVVRGQAKATTAVELLPSPPDEAKVGLLQERVETAFPRARKVRR